MKFRLAAILLALVVVSMSGCQLRAYDTNEMITLGWTHLASKTVFKDAEREIIPVPIKEGMFSYLQIIVRSNPIELNYVKVTYGNGQSELFPVRKIFTKDTRSRALNLKGFVRFIKSIEIDYRSLKKNQGPAIVEFWAKR